jgi:hypothetical protein
VNQYRIKPDLDELILRKLDGTISPSEYEQLTQLLQSDRQAAEYYIDFTLLYAALAEPGKIDFVSASEVVSEDSYNSLFALLAEEEKRAQALPVSSIETGPVLIEGVRERKKKLKVDRPISRFNLWFAIVSMAAMLLLVLYVIRYPRMIPVNVATLADSIDARWAAAETCPVGTRFKNNENLHTLESGLATIHFDYGAEIVLEGPAEFTFISAEKLALHYGRLFARVPSRAVGFTVDMPGGSVIDLGTEFGVTARHDGTGDVNLFSGSASLLAGVQGTRHGSRMLEPGQAKRVIGASGEVLDIEINPHKYVRRIDSATGIVWKGQPLDLADMLGGGNGLGTGRLEVGINPVSGMRGTYSSEDREGDGRYVLMGKDRYVDGVFVPNGERMQVVSSQGDIFWQCPRTNNLFYTEIIVGSGKLLGDFTGESARPLGRLGDQLYGTPECPAIFAHANLGITYDLEAIRKDFPEFKTCRFTAEAGLTSAAPREGHADIWILVDGQQRYLQKGITEKGKAYPIDIELKSNDRFLTLMTTDGGDFDFQNGSLRGTDSDWCVFVRPILTAIPEEKNKEQ